jgi:hypothetical protein
MKMQRRGASEPKVYVEWRFSARDDWLRFGPHEADFHPYDLRTGVTRS